VVQTLQPLDPDPSFEILSSLVLYSVYTVVAACSVCDGLLDPRTFRKGGSALAWHSAASQLQTAAWNL